MIQLNKLIKQANKKDIYTEKEQMTLRTAEIYLEYAKWNEKNIAWNTESFELIKSFKGKAKTMAQDLPNFERREVNNILQNAIDEITKVINGKYIRKKEQEANWSYAKLKGNKIEQNNRFVFLLEHFWKPSNNYLRFFGMADGTYISPNHLTNEKRDVQTYINNRLAEKPDGNLGFVFVDSDHIPQWAKEKYNKFDKDAGQFGKYDIDYQSTKELYKLYALPYIKGENYTKLGYMMFNEPSFFTENSVWNSREVSKYTIQNFKEWGVIVVYKTNVVTKNELNQLQQFLNQGEAIVIDESSLKFDEYGVPYKKLNLGKGKIVIANTLSKVRKEALKLLELKNYLPDIYISEENGNNYKTCIWKSIKNTKENYILTAINLDKTNAKINITHKKEGISLTSTNLLTGTLSENIREL